MRRVLIILLLSVGAVWAQRPVPPLPEATRLYVDGLKEWRVKGDGARAAMLFKEVLRLDSLHMGALTSSAAILNETALGLAKTASVSVPMMVMASDYARQAYKIDSTDKFVRALYTRTLVSLRRYDEALRITPDDIEAQLALADQARQQGDDATFLNTVRRLLQDGRITPEMKGELFEDMIRDRNFYARNFHTISSIARGMMAENPHNWRIVNIYATSLLAGGQTREGVEVYKNYISDTTSNKEPWRLVIDGETYLKSADSARVWVDRAIARFPDDASFRLQKGGVLAYLELHEESLAAYRDAAEHADNDSLRSVAHAFIGAEYAVMKQDAKAEREYREAIELDPDNVLALNNLAYNWAEKGRNLNKALTMAERVMQLSPDTATYVDTYGWILFKLGRLEDAKKAMRTAVAQASDPDLMRHYAAVLSALGDDFMAKYYLDKAEELEKKVEK